MKELPIIFSGPMVRAILKGMKFKTRRMNGLEDVNESPDLWKFRKTGFLDYMTRREAKGKFGAYFESEKIEQRTLSICPTVCPYGQPGDWLWVRESAKLRSATTQGGGFDLLYRADDQMRDFPGRDDHAPYKFTKWTPSIHMPRWASRISVFIKSVTVERLWDMTEEEARAEGIVEYTQSELLGHPKREEEWARYTRLTNTQKGIETPQIYTPTNLGAFALLWDKLNGNWNENPWVWVIEFAYNGV